MRRMIFALAAMALAGSAGAQPGATTPSAWFAREVVFGPEWRLFFVPAPTGVELIPAWPTYTQGRRLKASVRVELMTPETLQGFAWRSALVELDIDCNTKNTSQTIRVFASQNLTGVNHPAESNNILRRPRTAVANGLCRTAEFLREDARSNPRELPGPLGREDQAVREWVAATVTAGEWGPAIVGNNSVVMVKTQETAPASGLVRAQLRVELFEPTELTTGIARSLLETVDYDCAARTWKIVSDVIYPRRNLAGTKADLFPVRVLAFDSDLTLEQVVLNRVCGAGRFGEAAAPIRTPPPVVIAALESARAEQRLPAQTPGLPPSRRAEDMEAWVQANLVTGEEWTWLENVASGRIFYRFGPERSSVTLRFETAFPVTSVTSLSGGFGLIRYSRSWVTGGSYQCGADKLEADYTIQYEGQNLTGRPEEGPLILFAPERLLAPEREIVEKLCDAAR